MTRIEADGAAVAADDKDERSGEEAAGVNDGACRRRKTVFSLL
jgi:hypothetical protein